MHSTSSSSSSRKALAVLALASVAAASPAPLAQSSNGNTVHTYQLGKRGRSFADENGIFNPKLFAEDADHVASKYRHGNARYKRNLAQGKVQPRKRSSVVHPVHDVAMQKRQSGTSKGSVELIDCALDFKEW